MMEKRMKMMECFLLDLLVMFAIVVSAAGCFSLQFILRAESGADTGFFIPTYGYAYNLFFYILGVVLYIAELIVLYRFFWKTRPKERKEFYKVIQLILAVVFVILMFAVNVLIDFAFCGITVQMEPELLEMLSVYGWPVIYIAYMVFVVVRGNKE